MISREIVECGGVELGGKTNASMMEHHAGRPNYDDRNDHQ
jgi:hypothetical protein